MSGETCERCGWWIKACHCTGKPTGGFFQWKPMWYTDICETPIYIESKQQLKRECKKHGVIAARLL